MFDDQPQGQAKVSGISPRDTSGSITLSQPIKIDLKVYRGDSGRFRITVRDPSGNPIDISTATFDADIRLKATDATTLTSFDIVPVAGDPASIDVMLSAANSDLLTGPCVYDVEMTLSGLVTTLVTGSIAVTQDVSRT
jgi:hypothetical protein